MSDFGIFRMNKEDIEGVLEIEKESFSSPWSKWIFENELSNKDRSHFFVAKSGNEILGYVGFWLVFDEAHIVNIAVRKGFRRSGIGTLLLASALIIADRMGAEKATLEVRISNISAQKLYEKFGFEIISIRKKFYTDTNEDAYIMWIYKLSDKLDEIRKLGQNAQNKLKIRHEFGHCLRVFS